MQRIGGRLRSRGSGLGGANLGIPPLARLSPNRGPVRFSGQRQAGSLTGAVASQRVTEAPKGSLSTVGNRASSVRAQGSLTVRRTRRADAKAGSSDPAVASGSAVAKRLKGTPGITG